MRALLVLPEFPPAMWSFQRVLEILGRKVLLPPLNLTTVAALLPQDWEYRLVDRNARSVTESDWDWAELVLVSAMTAQREDFFAVIREAKTRGKKVAVGGPFVTTLPEDVAAAGADYLVLGEGELTIPVFVDALRAGQTSGRFSVPGQFANMTTSPVPRFDLLEFGDYETMSVQFSRGCPFQCEFCDVTAIYGRRARAKVPAQVLAELSRLYDLGWDRDVFIVDDNFTANRAQTLPLLRALKEWQRERGHPFAFQTEASLNLAHEPEMLDLMAECNFTSVFVGIETPDVASLKSAHKLQNTLTPVEEAVGKITRAGIRVMGSFILGFDGEAPGAGRRIAETIERAAIPTALVSLLQALPRTPLWERLEREGRLLGEDARLNPDTVMNFVPTRPVEEIAREYIELVWDLYEPARFLDRTVRYFQMLPPPRVECVRRRPVMLRQRGEALRTFLKVCWRLGVRPATRWRFWRHVGAVRRHDPRLMREFFVVSILIEQFRDYRGYLRGRVEKQLAARQRFTPSNSLKMPINTRPATS